MNLLRLAGVLTFTGGCIALATPAVFLEGSSNSSLSVISHFFGGLLMLLGGLVSFLYLIGNYNGWGNNRK
jgi:hypothetical protein